MTRTHARAFVLPALASMLPPVFAAPEADVLLLAIAWQESRLTERRQVGGPARSFWQFEISGVAEVLRHPASARVARDVITRLDYRTTDPAAILTAMEHHDVLAAAFARLALWRLPDPLPVSEVAGWTQYLRVWRPGKPKPDTWPRAWAFATETPA